MQHIFHLPDPGEGLVDADIVQWLVAPGESVTVNQAIVEIETAKSLVELPSPWDGVVAEILAPVGANVNVGAPIVAFEVGGSGTGAESVSGVGSAMESSADSASGDRDGHGVAAEVSGAVLVGYGVSEHTTSRRVRRSGASSAPSTPAEVAAPGGDEEVVVVGVLAKPPVRKLARDLQIDLTAVRGTGPGGIITRDDVVGYAEAAAHLTQIVDDDGDPWLVGGRVSEGGRQTRVPVKSVRRRTAEAMVSSAFTAPHVTVFHTVDVTRSMELLARMKEDREFRGIRLTPLLLAMKALLIAVARHPEVNASWDEGAQEIVYKHYVNLGIAASTPRGLIVPNIKDAHRLALKDLAHGLAGLTERARAGTTTPLETSDGTITVTNVGVFGIDTGTPILNPGEAAILAFGAIRQMPWVVDGAIVPRYVTQLGLSFDHRLVDGELGSRVLADVARVLEDPGQALIWG